MKSHNKSQIIVCLFVWLFFHTNHAKGFTALFFSSEAISALVGSKFLAMLTSVGVKFAICFNKQNKGTSQLN